MFVYNTSVSIQLENNFTQIIIFRAISAHKCFICLPYYLFIYILVMQCCLCEVVCLAKKCLTEDYLLFFLPHLQEIVGKVEAIDIDISGISPDKVIKEIFGSTLREIIDEVSIPGEYLSQPQLMGIARNTTSAGRPSSEYYTRYSSQLL